MESYIILIGSRKGELNIDVDYPYPHEKVEEGDGMCGIIEKDDTVVGRVELSGYPWRGRGTRMCDRKAQWRVTREEWDFNVYVCTIHANTFRIGRIESKAKKMIEGS